MKILVFDTETTGLPTERNAALIATHKWPYIVQLSYLIYDTEKNEILETVDNIIKLPYGYKLSQESQNIHRITNEMVQEKGVYIEEELIKFNEKLLEVDLIVAHNITFDKNMIIVECIRNKIINNFTNNGLKKSEFCTMLNSIELCKIVRHYKNGNEYYKYPKLMELHEYLFNTIPDGLHNSMVDILVCLRCYIKMTFDIDLSLCSKSYNLVNDKYSINV